MDNKTEKKHNAPKTTKRKRNRDQIFITLNEVRKLNNLTNGGDNITPTLYVLIENLIECNSHLEDAREQDILDNTPCGYCGRNECSGEC